MGNRLHVAKTYKVEYGFCEAFNWKVEEFKNLLSALGAYYTGETWDEEFEIPLRDWNNCIEKLKGFNDLDKEEQEDITDCLKELGYSLDETIEVFERYLNEYDKTNDWLHFAFF